MNYPDASASYMASVVTIYLEMPDTPAETKETK
jgi:hypothetical protein